MNTARFSPPSAASFLSKHGNTGEREADLDLLGVLRTLWRGKWLILLVVLCTVAATGFYAWRVAVPIYTATATVTLQNRDENVVELDSVLSGVSSDKTSLNTEVEVLRSRGLIDKLVDQLELTSDPEFNPFLRTESPWSPVALLSLGRTNDAEPAPSERVVRDKTVSGLLDALTVSNIRDTYVFQITAETQDPEKSALIADALARLYIEDQLAVKFEATEQATQWLTERASQLKVQLDQAEKAAQRFNSQIELISAERLEALNRQVKDFRDRHAGLSSRQGALEQRVAELETAAESEQPARMAEVAGNPALTQLQQRLAAGDDSALGAFERQFDEILERAREEAARGRTQREAVARSIAELEGTIAEQSAQALKLEQLKREAEASRLIYEHFLGRLKETSVQQGIHQADARILSRSALPLAPSSPRKAMLLPLAMLVGLLAGSLLVLLLEMRSNAFRTAEEMQETTGTVVIGQIPRAPVARRKRVLDYIVSKPTSALVEAVRNLRTSILLSTIDRTPKVIMLTSSMPGEGKSTLSLALAQNLASMGKKVLVIEGDIRRRSFEKYFDVKGRSGLLSVVLEDSPLEDTVFHDPKLGFDILLGERASINAADFFSSERFAAFLKRVRDAYDFVVIDTPPVLMVPDARVIAQSSDAVIYVVRWDATPRRQVMQGLQAFATVNAPVTGLVLSQIDPRGMKRYGYSGTYGQGYGTSSKKYHDS